MPVRQPADTPCESTVLFYRIARLALRNPANAGAAGATPLPGLCFFKKMDIPPRGARKREGYGGPTAAGGGVRSCAANFRRAASTVPRRGPTPAPRSAGRSRGAGGTPQ